MKHNKKILALAVTSAFAGAAFAAPVAVNFDSAPATAAATVASEIIAGSAVPAGFVLNGKTGWGFSPNTAVFVRYDLSNSATFSSAIASPALLMNDATGAVGANVAIALASGGAAASNAIYQVTANSAATAVQDTNANLVLTLAGNGVISPSSSTTVTLTQSVYDTSANAVAAGSTGRLSTKSVNLVRYLPSYTFSITAGTAQTADVNATAGVYKGFTGGVSSTTVALGTVTIANSGTTPLANGAGASTANTVLGTTSALTVTGDFTGAANANGTYTGAALSRVFLGSTTCAGTNNITANSLTATTATFPVKDATGAASNNTLCLVAEGNTAVPAASYTAVFNAAAMAGYTATAATSSTALGSIARNGGQLTTPWFSTATGYISRFVLTNTGATAAPYTVSVVTESGNTATTVPAGLSGSVAAGAMVVINATDIVSAFSGSSRGAVTFTFQTGRANVNGVYQVTSPTGGVMSTTMVAPGTN